VCEHHGEQLLKREHLGEAPRAGEARTSLASLVGFWAREDGASRGPSSLVSSSRGVSLAGASPEFDLLPSHAQNLFVKMPKKDRERRKKNDVWVPPVITVN